MDERAVFGGFMVCWMIVWLLSGIIGALTFPYAINFWLLYFGKAAAFMWYHGFLIGMIPGLGQIGIIGAIITFIFSFFI